jgi:CheY-like chemotaxis protein
MTRSKTLILVVDDVAAIRLLVGQVLQQLGADTIKAASGETALEMTHEHRPDLIVLDLVLPGISGLQVMEKLKSDPATAGIPVVILTALNGSQTANHALDLGAVGLIGKPFTIDQLRSTLAPWIDDEFDEAV